MFDLVLGIIFFNVLLVLFKFFDRFGVDNMSAITVNYFVAGILGFYFSDFDTGYKEIIESDWLVYALTTSFFFVTSFILVAKGSQKIGMAITTVANKMSLVVPVIFAFILLGDSLNWIKMVGICVALISVYLATTNGQKLSFDKKYIPVILYIFLGQGLADASFNYATIKHVGEENSQLFLCIIFLGSGIIGLLLMVYRIIASKLKLHWNAIIWGIALGVPNYLTLFYFLRALDSGILESSQFYPIFNMGVIVLSALIGFLFFKEKLSLRNWLGISLSILAIAAISLA